MIQSPTTGSAETLSRARTRMVERQLCARGISDVRVLQAMNDVPREAFVPEADRESAYADCPLPIDHHQTISQPYTVASMCEALRLTGSERLLEIGTGSGYAASVLSRLASRVYSIERIPELAQSARQRVAALGYTNVEILCGDGTLGVPEEAPFDAIIVAAGAPELPPAYASQIADGGRIVIPIGHAKSHQRMCRFTRHCHDLRSEDLGGFAFVPLIGQRGW